MKNMSYTQLKKDLMIAESIVYAGYSYNRQKKVIAKKLNQIKDYYKFVQWLGVREGEIIEECRRIRRVIWQVEATSELELNEEIQLTKDGEGVYAYNPDEDTYRCIIDSSNYYIDDDGREYMHPSDAWGGMGED